MLMHDRYFMDVCGAVPYFAMEKAKRKDVWDDGLHLYVLQYQIVLNISTHRAVIDIAIHLRKLEKDKTNFL